MTERWMDIVGPDYDYAGLYRISDGGRIMALEKWIARVHTAGYWRPAQFVADRVGNDLGHRCVTLYDATGRRRKHWVHRLVAEMYIPNPKGYPYVLHGLLGPGGNGVNNLRWGNQSMNERDKLAHKRARQEARYR